MEVRQIYQKVSSCLVLCSSVLLALSTQAEDLNAKRRRAAVIICSENMTKGFHQSGFEIGMVLFGINKCNYGYSED